jgi:tetratricopeptide (TPR) repeat protein
MFNFLKRKGWISSKEIDQAFERAVKRLENGDGIGAEREMHSAVGQAAQAGKDSPLYAKALFHEGTILVGVGDLQRAAERCREAASIPAKEDQSQKDRLTYWMNLGDLLTRMGELDEAEQVLRDSLEERRQFYGAVHAGYAYGLGSLGDLLLARDKPGEALAALDKAVAIYRPLNHEQLPNDLVLRALAVKAARGGSAPAFEDWSTLRPTVRQEIVQQAINRVEIAEPSAMLAVLRELLERLESTPDAPDQDILNVTISIANVARLVGDNAARIDASRRVVELFRPRKDPAALANAYEGLAYALGDDGENEEAERAYAEALAIAQRAGNHQAAANVLRNHAIWFDQRGIKERADDLHRAAVVTAEASRDPEICGRNLCAYGIFLQHEGKNSEAEELLGKAIGLLHPADPDAYCALEHLKSLRSGSSCGCGEHTEETFSALAEKLVMEQAPKGLLRGIKLHLGEDGPSVEVDTLRELTQAEMEELNRVIHQAIARMRQEYQRAGYQRS